MRGSPSTLSGPLTVTSHQIVDEGDAEELWALYVQAFAALQRHAAARQVLCRTDFDLEVLHPNVTKYVARDDEGRIVGLCTLTNDLTTVPWISPRFYQARYPAHTARDAVFYCGIAMVHPDARGTRAFARMVGALAHDIAAVDGILAADMCQFNIERAELAATVTLMMRRAWGSARLVELDTQVYMAWEPAGVASRCGPE